MVTFLSITVAVLFLLIAIFQVLLALGFPLGEFALGGFHKVLPKKWRFVSIGNAVILILFAWIFLQHAYILESILPFSTHVFVWIIAIFLALNSVANLFSVSKKEKYVMTPLSAAACILCFWIALL
ncbi:MAG: hypothetical protein AB2374_02045 [Cytobacillus gottheilii]|uniref:hypothetical protein n=1 Tax=Cytobacillus gottheilii TaxID=859144 RepID=UPI00346441F2